jgi:hypothetical protein
MPRRSPSLRRNKPRRRPRASAATAIGETRLARSKVDDAWKVVECGTEAGVCRRRPDSLEQARCVGSIAVFQRPGQQAPFRRRSDAPGPLKRFTRPMNRFKASEGSPPRRTNQVEGSGEAPASGLQGERRVASEGHAIAFAARKCQALAPLAETKRERPSESASVWASERPKSPNRSIHAPVPQSSMPSGQRLRIER